MTKKSIVYILIMFFITFITKMLHPWSLISQVLWPYLIIVTISILLNPTFYKKLFEHASKNEFWVFLSAFLKFVVWTVIIAVHFRRWTLEEWFISALWIIATLSWIVGLLFPHILMKTAAVFYRNQEHTKIIAVIMLLVGLIVSYFWYVA